ncbi:hypothetical protein BZA05DRAFT_440652 [Tricharina praecox]|uniref:uncharacterized protein n=1 Tax=Tricharina praecox TaxID=43433 RepID=UPI0022205995|nr:uncharacterized protein BZA05DRAFT_440652 [Tricharina praecox]KAI5859049.1 hypothetical protein BZA05DRAFT_440652 [Tricharina praecox]
MSLDNFRPSFIYYQLRATPKPVPYEGNDLSGKTALITGGNAGLGFECGRQLLRLKLSYLIITSRSLSRAEAARKLLLADKTTQRVNPNAKVDVYELDQERHEYISAFVEKLKESTAYLDIALLNAAINTPKIEKSPYGRERTIQINHVSTSLMSLLLLPLLEACPRKPANLTVVAGGTNTWTTLPAKHHPKMIHWMGDPASKGFDVYANYHNSKLLNLFWVQALAERVSGADVVVNAVCPAMADTNLFREYPRWLMGFAKLIYFRWITWSAEACARVLTSGVVKGRDGHGSLTTGIGVTLPFNPLLFNDEGKGIRERLWNETIEIFQKEAGFKVDVPAKL